MSGQRRPAKQGITGADLRTGALSGGGTGAFVKAIISLLPDNFLYKHALDVLAPWVSGGATTLYIWSKVVIHRRAIRNAAAEAIQNSEQELLDRTVDPHMSPEQRQEVREMLANLRMTRAKSNYEQAIQTQEELDKERTSE